jgi:hypothetical protein
MKTLIKLFIVIFVINLSSCKKQLEYKYSDKEDFLICDSLNIELYKEALYAFESDLLDYHGGQDSNITSSYFSFLHRAFNNSIRYNDIVSPHTLLVLESLKKETDLWDFENKKSNLNYNSSIINCISSNIQNKDIKTTFNALLSVNSMDPKLFGPSFATHYEELITDKHLALYVALDLYYAKLFDIDFTEIE